METLAMKLVLARSPEEEGGAVVVRFFERGEANGAAAAVVVVDLALLANFGWRVAPRLGIVGISLG
jgi:hypothetical protein